jgi:transposase
VLSAVVRIWICLEPVDMRVSFDGLAVRIQHQLQRDPFGGECFVFRSKDGTRAKALL